MNKIGVTIWGAGFVGATAYQAFKTSQNHNVRVWDIAPENSKLFKEDAEANFVSEEEALKSSIHFICVPTPMKKDTGECDISIVESVVQKITNKSRFITEIVIKSTVPVGTTDYLYEKYSDGESISFVFNPEFLTEANAYEDFISIPYQVIGSDAEYCRITDLYRNTPVMNVTDFVFLSPKEAEMVKLLRNCYLATRLSFFNEMKQFADKMGVDFKAVTSAAGLDERVGDHYNKVPGPDGKAGFSLSCLPKDLNDMIFAMREAGIKPTVLKAVWEKNLEVRPERDWEQMKKAVVE